MPEIHEQKTYEYEERFVAFIDILGFKELISSKIDTLDTLIGVIQLLRSEVENKPYVIEKENHMVFMAGSIEDNDSDRFHSSREISVFSDLVVISYEVRNEVSVLNNLHKLLHSIYFVQEHLSINSILIRGGISCGPLYHKGDICIGPALLRAYELESSFAKYPRVILDPLLIEQDRFKGIVGRWPDYMEKFMDEYFFITHFKPLRIFFDMYPENDLQVQIKTRRYQVIQILHAYKIAIERALQSNRRSIQEKGNWLNIQYIEVVKYFEAFYLFTPEERQYIDIKTTLTNALASVVSARTTI